MWLNYFCFDINVFYWIHFFIFWKCMLSKISGFLFMVTANGCFYFSIIIRHRTSKVQSTRRQKQALQILLFQLCFLWNMVFKIIVLKQAIEKFVYIQSKTQNSLTLSFIPPTYNTAKCFTIFLAIEIATFLCSYESSCFLYL